MTQTIRTLRRRNEEAQTQHTRGGGRPQKQTQGPGKPTWDRAYNGARGSRSVARERAVYKDTAKPERKRTAKMSSTRLSTSSAGTMPASTSMSPFPSSKSSSRIPSYLPVPSFMHPRNTSPCRPLALRHPLYPVIVAVLFFSTTRTQKPGHPTSKDLSNAEPNGTERKTRSKEHRKETPSNPGTRRHLARTGKGNHLGEGKGGSG